MFHPIFNISMFHDVSIKTCSKKLLVVLLKFEFNWLPHNLSGNPISNLKPESYSSFDVTSDHEHPETNEF